MASEPDEHAAFDRLAALLRGAATVSARALRAHRDTPAGSAADRQLEHTLDRLALLYGRGTYENLSTEDIFLAAVTGELMLAAELDGQEAQDAATRARSLIDASRRGVRLHVREPGSLGPPYRGVYVEPFSPELERALRAGEEPYLRWRDGAVLMIDEEQAAALRADGNQVSVLFLDPEELLDLDGRGDRPAFEAEMERRLGAARAASDAVGDSRNRYLLRLLERQAIVLRNLRDRLAEQGHESAHAALTPILASHRALHESRLAAAEPPTEEALRDPLGASIDAERNLVSHVSQWSAEPGDEAGLRDRFRAVADAGTRLADLEQHRPS